MLHWWLIPLLVIACLLLWGLYVLVRQESGSGERTPGRTLVDKPEEFPPAEE